MRVLFCGVRGSTCAPGAEFVRYGGHTACVALAHGDEPPTLALDAGTGLRHLTKHLDGRPFRGTILLGHLHWDYTHGIPFFAAGNEPGSEVTVVMPAQGDPEQVLERAFSPPHFPWTPTQLQGRWRVTSHEPGESQVEGCSVLTAEIPHKGGRTFGYGSPTGAPRWPTCRTTAPSPRARPPRLGAYHQSAMALARGADLLVHGNPAHGSRVRLPQLPRSLGHRVGRGPGRGGRCPRSRPHHDPWRTDDEIDALVVAQAGGTVEVVGAAEGLTIDL